MFICSYLNKPPEWVLINSTVSYHSKWEAYDPKKWLGKGGRLEMKLVRLCPWILEKDEWRQRDLKKQNRWNSCYCIGTNSCYCLNTTWSVTSSMSSIVFYYIRGYVYWQHRLLAEGLNVETTIMWVQQIVSVLWWVVG